jgi:hypothetical protein
MNPAMQMAMNAVMGMNKPPQPITPMPLAPGRGTPTQSLGEILFGRK